MPSDNVRSPEEIEREIEMERSDLNTTMRHLQERLSPDGLMRDVMETVGGHGSDLAGSAARVVQRHPAAIALTGLGLAWLAVSVTRDRSGGADGPEGYHRMGHDSDYPAYGVVHPETGRRTEYGTHPIDPAPRGPVPSGSTSDESSPWDSAGERMSGMRDSARDHADHLRSMGRGASDSAGRRYASAKAQGRGYLAQAGASARQLRDRISDGTSGMSEEARRRVIAARSRAYEAQVKAEYYAREGRRRTGDFYDEQPLVVGALAVAIGAAIGGALPSTRREDEAFGSYRDQLFTEAQRVYEEERSRLAEVARDTADEAKAQARDLADTVKEDVRHAAGDVRDKARDAVENVADTARKDAKEKGVGSSIS